jgi:hypothetical protein
MESLPQQHGHATLECIKRKAELIGLYSETRMIYCIDASRGDLLRQL